MEKENKNLITRPPIVVVMGHVDHGKTSLLLAIRKLNVPAGKPGGVITQHIGAYEIEKSNRKITFLDTPGHEAFSQMRSRGAKVADIAILVIAADEGLKTQTREAISHIKEAKIPLIVALNKTDKPNANPEKVKRELLKEGIVVESMGGKVPSVEISAINGKGIDELLELILLVSEMENLETDISEKASGFVIESCLDKNKGPIATLILEKGILRIGQIIGTSSTFGKVKNIEDFQGKPLKEALPSQPIALLGFEKPPKVGEEFKSFADLETAKANLKEENKSKKEIRKTDFKNNENNKTLNLILKADVLGSLEAIEGILEKIPQPKSELKLLKSEIGNITETDIKLAKHSQAVIFGFRVKIDSVARNVLKKEKVRIYHFNVIYDLVEELRKILEKTSEPEIVRQDIGKMKVLVVFLTEKNRQIVGGKVINGEIRKGLYLEVLRNEEIKGKGKIINLQKNKKDVDVVRKGEEAGILYEGNVKIETGDILIIFDVKKSVKS